MANLDFTETHVKVAGAVPVRSGAGQPSARRQVLATMAQELAQALSVHFSGARIVLSHPVPRLAGAPRSSLELLLYGVRGFQALIPLRFPVPLSEVSRSAAEWGLEAARDAASGSTHGPAPVRLEGFSEAWQLTCRLSALLRVECVDIRAEAE